MGQVNTAVRFRLSNAQIAILAPAIDQITQSYQARLHSGISPFSYPFRIYPPPPDFDRGVFNQQFMNNILAIRDGLKKRTRTGKSLQMDTFQLRAAVFAIRAYIDFVRLLRRQHRRKGLKFKMELNIDDKSFAQLKAKSKDVISSLERHMKRANRSSLTAVGKEQYKALTIAWKAHLQWMRLHIAYYKPLGKPNHYLRKQHQREIDDLVQMAKRGLRNAGYQPPEEKDLCFEHVCINAITAVVRPRRMFRGREHEERVAFPPPRLKGGKQSGRHFNGSNFVALRSEAPLRFC